MWAYQVWVLSVLFLLTSLKIASAENALNYEKSLKKHRKKSLKMGVKTGWFLAPAIGFKSNEYSKLAAQFWATKKHYFRLTKAKSLSDWQSPRYPQFWVHPPMVDGSLFYSFCEFSCHSINWTQLVSVGI
jgi:hypothetical protein